MTKKQKGGAITIRVPTKPNPSTLIKPPPVIRPTPTKAPIVIKPPVIIPTPTKAPIVIKPPVIRPTLTLPPTPRTPSIPAKFSTPTTLQQKSLPVMPTTTIRSLPLITSTFPIVTTTIGISSQLNDVLIKLGGSYEQLKNSSNLSNGPIDFNKAVKISTLVIQEGNEALMLITKELASSPSNPLLISIQNKINAMLQTVSVQQAYIKSAIIFNILIEDTQPLKDTLLTESINNVRTKVNSLVTVANDGLALVRTGLTTTPSDPFLLNAQKSFNLMLDVVKISEAVLQFMQDSKKMSELSNSSPLNKDLIVSHATIVIEDANIILKLVKTGLASQSEMPSTYIPWLKNLELGCNSIILNIPKWLDSIKGVAVTTTLNSQIDQVIQSAFNSYNKFVDDMKASSKSLPTVDAMNRLTVQAYNVMSLAVTTEELINTTMINDSKNVSLIMSRQFMTVILAVMKLMIQILNLGNEMDISGSFRPQIFHQTSITKILDTIPTVNKVIDNALQILPGHNWIISVKSMIQEIKQSYTTVLSQINATTILTPQTSPQTTTQTPLTADEQAIQRTFDLYNQFAIDLKSRINSSSNTDDTTKLDNQLRILRDNVMVTQELITKALENDSNNAKFIMYKENITAMLATITFMRHIINQQYWVAKSDKLYATQGVLNLPANRAYVQIVLDNIPVITTATDNAFRIPGNTWIANVRNTIEEIKGVYTIFLSKLNSTTTRISGGRSRKFSSKKRTSTYKKKRNV